MIQSHFHAPWGEDRVAVDGSGTGTPRTRIRCSLRFATAAVVGPYGTNGYGSTVPVKNTVVEHVQPPYPQR